MTMSASITSSRTDNQVRQVTQRFEAAARRGVELALRKVDPDRDGVQRLIGVGAEADEEIINAILNVVRSHSVPNQFADEEVASSYTYPPEYTGPKPIEEQITALAKILDLDPASALAFAESLPALPEGAEGWFAIPSSVALATKHFPSLTDPAEQNCAGISLILSKIAALRKFYNHREGQITTAQLRVAIRTAEAMAQITETQKGDILIIAAQLGLRHRGESVRRAREKFVANEFGLGSLIVGAITLTHPARLVRWEQLHTDCAGDEFSPEADGEFDFAPYFSFDGGKVKFDTYWVSDTSASFGSASGFLPQ